MKAIIQGAQVDLTQTDGTWLPADGSECEITKLHDNKLFMVLNGKTYTAVLLELNKLEKELVLMLNGQKAHVKLKEPLDDLLHAMGLDTLATQKAANIKAPMPGLVLEVAVSIGDSVSKGDKVLVLEAMKMENIIKAPGDGIVARILVDKGQTVDKNDILIEFQ